MFNRKWRFNPYSWPPWLRRIRDGFEIIILPLAIFQMIRTIFFPTTFDVVIFVCLGTLYVLFLKRII